MPSLGSDFWEMVELPWDKVSVIEIHKWKDSKRIASVYINKVYEKVYYLDLQKKIIWRENAKDPA